ncbi:MAG: mechanosensitive ion channel family protein [Desulfuromonas sp.]|uniref:mechanosensitive ion channel family protein n=1 Tax=Desulfuromonas sp. TaxID=892 RepID=UPI000CC291F1|nr:mechanosensitive ion channel family protein [Desulfuromonas sp.]PLX85199.1 MAG: mechanosensitive ion channel family protein [Desulfuromonas sp.]
MLDALAGIKGLYRDFAVIGGELAIVVVALLLLDAVVRLAFRRLDAIPPLRRFQGRAKALRRSVRWALFGAGLLLCAAVAAYNGLLIYRGVDVFTATRDQFARIPPDFWKQLGIGAAKVVALVIAARLIVRWLRKLIGVLEGRAMAFEQLRANDEAITAFFAALRRIVSNAIWLSLLIVASGLLPFPAAVPGYLTIALNIYLAVALGLLLVHTMAVIIDSLEALSKKYWYREGYLGWYERLSALVPLLRRCLEYVIYVAVATVVLSQLQFIAHLAVYGPKVVKAIGIVFLAKVAVEIANLLVDRSLSGEDDASEVERQRRLTIGPIVKSLLGTTVYFVAFVLILRAFDLNPLPILAGAGILGVVIGFGAQPLINDVVSGFFILFENLYLVGDYMETGNARGTVESIALRTTRIRDPNGQVHILRNGLIGEVVNFSKEYTHAVVEVGVAYESDLNQVYRVLGEVGSQFQKECADVLEPTQIRGLKDFGDSALLVRTVTRVKPGRHRQAGFALRKLIKEAFDREGIEIPFAQRVVSFKEAGGRETFEEEGSAPQPEDG